MTRATCAAMLTLLLALGTWAGCEGDSKCESGCAQGEVCTSAGCCTPCGDGCCGSESVCVDGECCQPDCTGRECGPDPVCGSYCGPGCYNIECTDGQCSCGTREYCYGICCDAGQTCASPYNCCTPGVDC
ncbi:MAG: hypothetical protein ABI333_06835 [bacterium]